MPDSISDWIYTVDLARGRDRTEILDFFVPKSDLALSRRLNIRPRKKTNRQQAAFEKKRAKQRQARKQRKTNR